jgi:uncharacterized membrane protein YgcG
MAQLFTLVLLLTATTAWAQTPTHADRWVPWMGCWQISEESVEDAERLLSGLQGTQPTSRNGARVCVTPSGDGGATMTTMVSGKEVLTETIVPDGAARALTDPSCTGTQRAEWSAIGPRIFARTEVACGHQAARVITGYSAVVAGPLWVDIQMIESEGRSSLRVRRYRPVADTSGPSARSLSTLPLVERLSLADIKEASAKVAPQVVQAAILEMGRNGYDLTAARLIDLDDAGVHDSVIDLMVAMSFPQKFVVERARPVSGPGSFGGLGNWFDDPWGYRSPGMWGYYAHPMYYASYFSPFGYYNWGYYDPYYYGTPGVVIINPGGDTGPPPGTGEGRVVNGEGYTRIRPNVPDAPARPGNGTNSGWTGSSAGSNANSGSNSGGSVSSGGYSGGGSSSGGERVAVPRPPGGY